MAFQRPGNWNIVENCLQHILGRIPHCLCRGRCCLLVITVKFCASAVIIWCQFSQCGKINQPFYFLFYIQTLLPAIFQQLEELDDKRIKQIENYIRKGVDIERSVFPIINKCLDGIIRAADSIDPEKVHNSFYCFNMFNIP